MVAGLAAAGDVYRRIRSIASAGRPARHRSAARRIRNGISAARSTARESWLSQPSMRPKPGKGLVADRVRGPLGGPGGDDAVE